MSTTGKYVTEHVIGCELLRAGHEAASTAGFRVVAVARCSGGISSAAAAPIATVIAPIVSAGTNPSTKALGASQRPAGNSRQSTATSGQRSTCEALWVPTRTAS